MTPFAKDTEVSVDRSRAAIEAMLRARGCTSFQAGWDQDRRAAHVLFVTGKLRVGLLLPFPELDAFRFSSGGRERTKDQAEKAWRSEERRRWRALWLVIKAKLEAIDSGISTLEREFLADVVLSDGSSVGDALIPQLPLLQPGDMLRLGPGSETRVVRRVRTDRAGG